MSPETENLEQRLADFKRAFDESFAKLPQESSRDEVEYLRIIAGDMPLAVRLSEISGLAVDLSIVSLPMSSPGLLGLGAIRGRLVPVFEVAAVLGAARTRTPRWVITVGDRETIALAFDQFEGLCRVSTGGIHPLEAAAGRMRLTSHSIQVAGRTVHVIDVALLISVIRQAMHSE